MDDRVLAGLVERGQSREAVAAYLDSAETEVLERCAALGLAAPVSRPLRESRQTNAWQIDDIRKLIDAWVRNHHVGFIASALSRSTSAIYGKARRLGLFRRKRSELVRELPLFAWAEKGSVANFLEETSKARQGGLIIRRANRIAARDAICPRPSADLCGSCA